MPINWALLEGMSAKRKAHSQLKKIITAKNYGWGPGEWNLTELIQSKDARKYLAYQILEGVMPDGRKHPGAELRDETGGLFCFKLQVLTRQACIRDKNGRRIWLHEEARDNVGESDDLVPDAKDKPKPGDVVEIKGYVKTWDDEHDREVDASVKREWSMQGKRPEEYQEYVLDKDCCIEVPYPFVLQMMSKNGERLVVPQFKKRGRRQGPQKRRITNWWYREVHQQEPVKG